MGLRLARLDVCHHVCLVQRALYYYHYYYYTHGDGGQQSLWDVGDDDADEEDDCVEPVVAEDERYHEERDAEEDRDAGDEVDEVRDLARDRRLRVAQTRRQVRDPTHHRPITRVHHQTTTRACSPAHKQLQLAQTQPPILSILYSMTQ